MNKDFNGWNNKKKETEIQNKDIIFYEREVWWCVIGINLGVEIDGKHEMFLRPSIIVRKFNKDMALVVPTTTQDKNNKYYLKVTGEDMKIYNTCLSQIRTISSKRLIRKIGTITNKDYKNLVDKLSSMIKTGL